VHVAQRDAHEPGSDAASAHLDRARIGAGRARVGFDLIRDF
jgi:hypothetical protein